MLYLIHSVLPIGGTGSNGAQHYLGYSPSRSTLLQRIARHREGHGACLTRAMMRLSGQKLLLANVWEGTRLDERTLKNRHQLSVLCPVCNPHAPTGSVSTPLPPLRSPAYKRLWPRRAWGTGGVLQAIRQMHSATSCLPAPPPANATLSPSAAAPRAMIPGGGGTNAPAKPRPAGSTSLAGTRRRVTTGAKTSSPR
jgi:hypothetical protein